MNIVIKENKKERNIEVGDIIVLNGDTYMIQRDTHGWVAKDLNGEGGATGRKNSLEMLLESFKGYDIEHYSQQDYDLVLVPKSKN